MIFTNEKPLQKEASIHLLLGLLFSNVFSEDAGTLQATSLIIQLLIRIYFDAPTRVCKICIYFLVT